MVDLRSFPGAAELYFIRHGESEGNRDGIMQGRDPSRLTESGRAQAEEAGAWFKDKTIDLILSSPLTRAYETAQIIARETGVTGLEIAPELTEIDTGIFTGMSWPEAREKHPEQFKVFQAESWEGVPEAERIAQLLDRAEKTWARLAALAGEGKRRLLCVTHSGFLQWIIKSTFGGRAWMPLFSAADNCCISHMHIANAEQGDSAPAHYAAWLAINSKPFSF
jgi:broad specificity phosphatase PhoE